MNGGKLVQHVIRHAIGGTHPIKFNTGEVLEITSTHHQMMMPYNLSKDEYELIAVAYPPRSPIYESEDINHQYTMEDEPEIVWYPNTKSFCIQGHPEMMDKNDSVVKKINSLIELYYGKSSI